MSDAAVAGLVERGDPERWRSAMTAKPLARPGLMALYALLPMLLAVSAFSR